MTPVTTDYLDKKIEALAEALDKRLDEKLDDFSIGLFKHLDRRFGEVNNRIDAVDTKYDRLMETLDPFLKRQDHAEASDLAGDARIVRLER